MTEQNQTDAIDVSQEELHLTITKIQDEIQKSNPMARKAVLLEKAQSGSGLEGDENKELIELLSGRPMRQPETLSDGIQKSWGENSSLQKAVRTDVTGYLRDQQTEILGGLSALAEHVEATSKTDHELTLMMAKAIGQMGTLVKSLTNEVRQYGRQESTQPTASANLHAAQSPFPQPVENVSNVNLAPPVAQQPPTEVIEKSFGAPPSQQQQPAVPSSLNKSIILNTLNVMHKDSMDGSLHIPQEEIQMAIVGMDTGTEIDEHIQAEVIRRNAN